MVRTIFYGPLSEFQKIIDISDSKTIADLAIDYDKINRMIRIEGRSPEVKIPKIKNLIAYSDNYSSISESAIGDPITFISSFEIENMFFQNPPDIIIKKLKKYYPDFEEKYHEYPHLNENEIKNFYVDYSNTIIGQDDIKDKIAISLYSSLNIIKIKPLVILFYGPTGVGKTETAKLLSKSLDTELLRKEFSMLQNNDFSEYIFGAKHNQSSLAKDLLDRESRVILFDEFDKCAPIFHSAFYKLFDEGIFEDKNYSVKVKDTILICTSNYTSESDIKKNLGNSLYSRFDLVVGYHNFQRKDILKLIENEFNIIMGELVQDQKDIIESKNVRDNLRRNASYCNAREIKKGVREVVYYCLLEQYLDKSD